MAMTIEQFGAEVKKKYPQYRDIDDASLGQQVLEKYPQYQRALSVDQPSSVTPAETVEKRPNLIQRMARPFLRGATNLLNVVEGADKLFSGDIQGAQQSATRSRDFGFLGQDIRPVGVNDQGELKNTGDFAKDVIGTGLEIGSYAAPVGALGRGASFGAKIAQGINTGIVGGGVGALGSGLQKDQSFGQTLKQTVVGAAAGGLTGGLLSGIGGTPKALGSLSQKIFQRAPSESAETFSARLMNSIIKPLEKEFRFGRDPGATLTREGIIANSQEDLFRKIIARKEEVGKAMDQVLSAPDVASKKLNVKPAIDAMDASIKEAVSAGNSVLVKRLREIKGGLEYNYLERGGRLVKSEPKQLILSPKEVQELKQQVGSRIKWTGETFGSEVNQAQRKVYDALNELINGVATPMRELNERWGGLLSAERSLERTMNVGERGALIKMGDIVTGAAGAATAGPIGLSLIAARHVAESTWVKTRLAKYLRVLGGEEGVAKLLIMPKSDQAKILKKIPLLDRPAVQAVLDQARNAAIQASRVGATSGSSVPQSEAPSLKSSTQAPQLSPR